jgi:hypothetical protein
MGSGSGAGTVMRLAALLILLLSAGCSAAGQADRHPRGTAAASTPDADADPARITGRTLHSSAAPPRRSAGVDSAG